MTTEAPQFTLPDTAGNDVTLPRRGVVVLYFYPKADTPGCTKQAKQFTKLYPQFIDAGAQVIGVSPDPADAVCDFREKHDFSHTLLADEDHAVCEAYGVWGKKQMFGNEYMGVTRTTFLIKDGEIIEEYTHKPGTTEQELLSAVKEL